MEQLAQANAYTIIMSFAMMYASQMFNGFFWGIGFFLAYRFIVRRLTVKSSPWGTKVRF